MSLTTVRALKLPSNLPFVVKEIIDITDQLPTYKGGWLNMPTRRKDGSIKTGPRPFEDITHISLHHTATEGGTAIGHTNYHIRKGDAGIAYHIYIKGDQIYQVNDLMALTWHTGSNNHHTIGIAVEGNFAKRDLTTDERNCLYAAVMAVREVFNVPVEHILGHKEFAQPTTCPAYNMNQVRKDLTDLVMLMEFEKSMARKSEIAHAIGNQILYMLNLMKGKDYDGSEAPTGKVEWATNRMMELYPFMKERGLVK